MNRVELTGRLTKNIELRYTDAEKSVTAFNIAVQRKYKNKDGDYECDFIRCKAFNQPAEFLNKYAEKGTRIGIEGRIQTGSYDDKDGKTVYTTDVICENVEILSDRTNTEPKEEVVEEPKEKLSDDVFADFGSSIEISDEDIAF